MASETHYYYGKEFLTNRHQRVVLWGHYSPWTSLHSGIPQGTVFGPILFVFYVNDITCNLESQCKLFTDDMKVYKVLRNVQEDTLLQNDLNALEQRSTEWQLSFNTTKCEPMRISKKVHTSCREYYSCGNKLNTVSETKDLSIYVTSNLSCMEPTGH